MTMTKQTRRPKRKTGELKMLLLTSSLVATLAGTQLLNIKERCRKQPPLNNDAITMVEPQLRHSHATAPYRSQHTNCT